MVRSATIIHDWIAEAEARDEARGRVLGAREMTLDLLRHCFGELPATVVHHVERLGVAECKALLRRLINKVPMDQLFPPDPSASE